MNKKHFLLILSVFIILSAIYAYYVYAQNSNYAEKINLCIQGDTEIESELSNFSSNWKNRWGLQNFPNSFIQKATESPKKYIDLVASIVDLPNDPCPSQQIQLLYEKYYDAQVTIDTYENRFNSFLKTSQFEALKNQYSILSHYNIEIQKRVAYLLFSLDTLYTKIANNQQISKSETVNLLIDIEGTSNYFISLDKKIDIESHIEATKKGYIIIGGRDKDIYNQYPAYLVIDVGGSDEYYGSFAHAGKSLSVVIDISGNDFYRCDNINYGFGSGKDDGVGVLFDFKGDDVYFNKSSSQGYGSNFGVGVLWDKTGKDVYSCTERSQGYGELYGIGLLIDNEGDDTYKAIKPPSAAKNISDAQGVGRVLGVGILTDNKGNDTYLANFSAQGMGWGLINYRWYGGLGILCDKEGNDTYYSEWYSLGAAVHGSFGSFFDFSGNDQYYVSVTQGLGSASDFSIASFLDKAGNDLYIFNSDSCGAGMNNAIAYFIDEKGDDKYSSDLMGRGDVSPADGYDEQNGISLGIFYDLEGDDIYPEGSKKAENKAFKERKESNLRRGIFRDD